MTEDEMRDEINEWFDGLFTEGDGPPWDFEQARLAAKAHSTKAEYWFMKGWVARNA